MHTYLISMALDTGGRARDMIQAADFVGGIC